MARRTLAAAVAVLALTGAGCAADPSAGADRSSGSASRPATPSGGTHAALRASAPAAASTAPVATSPASAAPAAAPATPCRHNVARQAVVVSVHRQHVWMCERHANVFDSPVTTGAVGLPYDATPTGTFHVQEKDRHRTLTLLSGAQYTVRYWIPFDAPLFGFHDAPWQTMPYGSAGFRTQGSHGCVHMPLPAMRFLYRWADVGATVRVRA